MPRYSSAWRSGPKKPKLAAPKLNWLFRGVVIFRSTEPGSRLRYTARHDAAGMLAADTLQGMKELIREADSKESR